MQEALRSHTKSYEVLASRRVVEAQQINCVVCQNIYRLRLNLEYGSKKEAKQRNLRQSRWWSSSPWCPARWLERWGDHGGTSHDKPHVGLWDSPRPGRFSKKPWRPTIWQSFLRTLTQDDRAFLLIARPERKDGKNSRFFNQGIVLQISMSVKWLLHKAKDERLKMEVELLKYFVCRCLPRGQWQSIDAQNCTDHPTDVTSCFRWW